MVSQMAWTKSAFSVSSVDENSTYLWSLQERVPKPHQLSQSPCHFSVAYSSLFIHSASILIKSPSLSLLTAPLVVWGVQPRCFPQAIRRLLFKCLHRADVPNHSPQLTHPPIAETFLSAPESTSCCCCVFHQRVTAGTRESHTDDCSAGELLDVCVCVCSLFFCSYYSYGQMLSTG